MLKFNSGKMSRDEALHTARLMQDKVNFFKDNPTIQNDNYQKLADAYENLIKEHGITQDEIDGKVSTDLATQNQKINLIGAREKSPIDIWAGQDSVLQEHGVNRANKRDRNHDLALGPSGFRIGYNPTNGQFDSQGFTRLIQQRQAEFNPEDHPDFDPEQMDDLREAYGFGMDPEHYKNARAIGVPHDYLTEAFVRSIRPHTVQIEEGAKSLGNINGVDFRDTVASNAAAQYREDHPEEYEAKESKSTDLATGGTGFIPVRMAVMHPTDIASAYQNGISREELSSAWRNNGFHPLRGYGSDWTRPIADYIAVRGAVGHDDAKALLSSLTHIPFNVYKRHLNRGFKPAEILEAFNKYPEFSAQDLTALDEGKKEIEAQL